MCGMSVVIEGHSYVQVVMGSSSLLVFVFAVVCDLYTANYDLNFIVFG